MDPPAAPGGAKRPPPAGVGRGGRCVRAKGAAARPPPGGGGPPSVGASPPVDPTAASAGAPPGAAAADAGGRGAADAASAAGGAPAAGGGSMGALGRRLGPPPTAFPTRAVDGAPLWSAVRVGAAKAYGDTPLGRLEAAGLVGMRVYRVVPPAAAAAPASAAGGGTPVAPTREPYDLWYLPPPAVERAAAVHKLHTPAGWYVAAAAGDEVEVDLVGTAADDHGRVVDAAVASLAAGRHPHRPQLRGSVLVDGGSLGYTQALANLDGGGLPPTSVPFCGYGRWEGGELVYTARIRLGKTVDAHATTAGVAGGGAAVVAKGGAAAVGSLTAEFFVRAEATKRRHGHRRPHHKPPSAGAPPAVLSENDANKNKTLCAGRGAPLGAPPPDTKAGGAPPSWVTRTLQCVSLPALTVAVHVREAAWFGRHGFADATGAPVGVDRARHDAVVAAAAAADAARRAVIDAGVRASAARVAAAAATAAAGAADGGVAAGGGGGGTPPRPRPPLVDLTATEPTGQ